MTIKPNQYLYHMKNLLIIFAMFLGVGACTVQKPLVKCGDESELIYPKAPSFFRASTASTPCAKRKVLVKLEMSNLGYIYRRDTTVMKAYQKMIFDSVALIFRNEPIPITLELVINKVWATADPYTAFTTGSTVLNAFAVTEFAKPEQSAYNIAVYVDRSNGANNKGSYGYRNGLNPGYYGQKYAYVCVPFGEPGTKDFRLAVKTMAHEIGHLFGLFHTSHCGNVRDNGTIGPLDSCASPEPISGQPVCRIPRKVITNGTIMSYCDVVSYLGGVDLKKGFGFKSMRTTMQQTLASCTTCPCDVSAPEPQPCTYTYSSWSACQPNGTQSRAVISQTPTGCTGTPILSQSCVYVPPVVSDGVIGPVMHYTQNATSFFRFGIPLTGDWRYEVAYCRYDGTMNPPDSATPPAQCGIRNALNFSRPTAAQLSAGQINLLAITQPAERNKWYRVRVRYRNGSNGAILVKQSAWFWW